MHHSNDIDDAMNNLIIVIDHQQKRSLFLYNIHSAYLYTVSTRATGWL